MAMKSDAKFKEELTCRFKIDMWNLTNFDPSTQKSQKLNGLLLIEVHNGWVKKVQRRYASCNEEWCKIWRKTDLWFGKWHKEFGKFSPEHFKVSNLGQWGDSFIQSKQCMSLKFTEELCHDNEEWCKIWRGIDLSFQNWHEEFDKFWPNHSKFSKICTLVGSFWTKYIIFELKKYREVLFDGTEDWCKIWRKTDLYFLKWHEDFGKFSVAEK